MAYIYLLRHARTVANEEHKYCGKTESPILDSSLSALKKLSAPEVDAVYCSPSVRCRETAITVGFNNIAYANELAEMDFGEWEEKTFDQVCATQDTEAKKYLDNPLAFTFPQGESFDDLSNRIKLFYSHFLPQHFKKEDTLAIIGHGGSLKMLLIELLGIDQSFFWKFTIEHGHYTILHYTLSENIPIINLRYLNATTTE